MRPNVLTMAGFDGSGGSGIQADLRTFGQLKVNGLSLLTTLSSQGPGDLTRTWAMEEKQLWEQGRVLWEAMPIHAVKIGWIGSGRQIPVIMEILEQIRGWNPLVKVVLDPVLGSTSGYSPWMNNLKEYRKILTQADLLTPNLMEMESLSDRKIQSDHDREAAYGLLKEMGVKGLLLKDGHGSGKICRDILYHRGKRWKYYHPRLNIAEVRGTGCVLSSAIAAYLARGDSMVKAIGKAQFYMQRKIRTSKRMNLYKKDKFLHVTI